MANRTPGADILNRALTALKKETNITFEMMAWEASSQSQGIDAFIAYQKTNGEIAVEIKSVQKSQCRRYSS